MKKFRAKKNGPPPKKEKIERKYFGFNVPTGYPLKMDGKRNFTSVLKLRKSVSFLRENGHPLKNQFRISDFALCTALMCRNPFKF